ncbi:hypothetical protein Lfu02_14140 [Longispora fulva]|uniref:Ribosomal protein S27AE n=1 Tax=Longispora fulva TaxID=619741 RepID=A0A8J7GLR4_9ACTN|nr:hypothetical protein [Longispora fulva]MBG6140576.1 ribosomal protein S27AE [Longispora fulva]GIG57042.1 hypothetical protein Lfu02_14140 [Longispora fulva]
MSLLLARTNAEAHLYMELQPCGTCGATEFHPRSSVVMAEGDLASRYHGACPNCGTEREYTFRIPEDIIFPEADRVRFGADEPSELLDPGDWLWVADLYTRHTPADPGGLPDADRARFGRDLATAVAAIEEVLKFVPAGADQVPPEAFFSERGREVYATEPGRFRAARLKAVEYAYRELAEGFLG